MNEVTLYRFDRSLKVVEDGVCSLARAMQEIELCSLNAAVRCDTGDEAMQLTTYGLSRSEADFIEISFARPDLVAVHSDRLHFPSRLARMFSSKSHFWIEGTKEDAKQIVQSYFDLPRMEFETRYESSLCR